MNAAMNPPANGGPHFLLLHTPERHSCDSSQGAPTSARALHVLDGPSQYPLSSQDDMPVHGAPTAARAAHVPLTRSHQALSTQPSSDLHDAPGSCIATQVCFWKSHVTLSDFAHEKPLAGGVSLPMMTVEEAPASIVVTQGLSPALPGTQI